MSKHKNRKLSKAVEPVQQAIKNQANATVASKSLSGEIMLDCIAFSA